MDGTYEYAERDPFEWRLHNPIDGTETAVLPGADRGQLKEMLDAGCTLIRQSQATGYRVVATLDELPDAPEPVEVTLVESRYVDARIDLLEAALGRVVAALQGYLPQSRVESLRRDLEMASGAIAAGDTDAMETMASDMGVADGPSIE